MNYLNPTTSMASGREALTYFHNAATREFGDKYKLKLDELISAVGGAKPELFLQNFGSSINFEKERIGFSSSDLKSAMENLAYAGKGQIPKGISPWFQALANEQMNYTWTDAIPFVLQESAKDIAKGTAEVGNAVIDFGKTFLQFAPLAAILGIGFIAFQKTKRFANK